MSTKEKWFTVIGLSTTAVDLQLCCLLKKNPKTIQINQPNEKPKYGPKVQHVSKRINKMKYKGKNSQYVLLMTSFITRTTFLRESANSKSIVFL